MSAKDAALTALEEFGAAESLRGYDQGLADMLRCLEEQGLHACRDLLETPEPAQVPAPADGEVQVPQKLSPYLRRAHDYLRAHPGTTVQQALRECPGAKSAFYVLVQKGGARKEGLVST
jgi:hypothetical protein